MSTSPPSSPRARSRCALGPPRSPSARPEHAAGAADEVEVAPHLVIEDRDVAGGLVRDRDLVPVLVQLAQHAAHRDHVVVGVRAEHDDPAPARELALAPDLGDQAVEDLAVDRLRGAVARDQRAQVVVAVVDRGEAQDALPRLLGEPEHRLHLELGRPLDLSDQPRRPDARELSGRGRVQVDGRVRVLLQVRRGDVRVDVPFDRAADDPGLVLAGRDQRDLPRLEDRRDAHRDRLGRHVLLAEEVGRGVLARDRVQVDEPRARAAPRARLVEADVPAPAHTQDLEVDAPGAADRLLVFARVCVHLAPAQVATRDVHVLGADVHVLEQILPHEPVVAVDAPRVHGKVFVEVERHRVREGEPLLAVHADQLAVDAHRGRAGCKPEHGTPPLVLPAAHHLGDALRDHPRYRLVVGKDHDGNRCHRVRLLATVAGTVSAGVTGPRVAVTARGPPAPARRRVPEPESGPGGWTHATDAGCARSTGSRRTRRPGTAPR